MIIRRNVDDQQYLEPGEKFSAAVVYINGCAVTLIDPDWILTAAHCVAGSEDSIFTAFHNDKTHRIEAIIVHPAWDEDMLKKMGKRIWTMRRKTTIQSPSNYWNAMLGAQRFEILT